MKTALKLFVASAVFVAGGILAASSAQAASLLKSTKITLDDTRAGQQTQHVFQFTASSAVDLEEIYIRYCKEASGTCTPSDNIVGAPLALSSTQGGTMDGTWTLSSKVSSDAIVLRHPGGDDAVAQDEVFIFSLTGATNPSIAGCNAATSNSSSTCYVRIVTYADINQTTAADSATASITVVAETTATATVDPTFTFVIGGVNTGVVNNQITTSVSSTYSSLPFGNLTAETPKYAAQALTVTTNTQAGYTVTSEMRTQMTGVYSANNIDPFAASGATWANPVAWVQPVGTAASTDTAWFGANTTDTGVQGWNSSPEGKFGPISSTANIVSTASTSDPGNAVYVTYAVEANVYQPADQYSGTLQYTATPTY